MFAVFFIYFTIYDILIHVDDQQGFCAKLIANTQKTVFKILPELCLKKVIISQTLTTVKRFYKTLNRQNLTIVKS